MKILVTGATGFVGRHLVPELLLRRHEILAVARDRDNAKKMPWYEKVTFVACDIHDPKIDFAQTLGVPNIIVHLAWSGLPNYKDSFHLEKNLPADCLFLKKIIMAGTQHVVVTGTCLEYGMQNGALSEETTPMPTTPYGLAKDKLRKFLQELQTQHPFTLQWARLFYMYGAGQNPKSLLAQLDYAIESNAKVFNMSGGEQIRDYLPVEDVARYLATLVDHPECSGIINCCSGKPISIRQLVENRIAQRKANIKLNLGHYPYPDYEPMAFWGDNTKLKKGTEHPCP